MPELRNELDEACRARESVMRAAWLDGRQFRNWHTDVIGVERVQADGGCDAERVDGPLRERPKDGEFSRVEVVGEHALELYGVVKGQQRTIPARQIGMGKRIDK